MVRRHSESLFECTGGLLVAVEETAGSALFLLRYSKESGWSEQQLAARPGMTQKECLFLFAGIESSYDLELRAAVLKVPFFLQMRRALGVSVQLPSSSLSAPKR